MYDILHTLSNQHLCILYTASEGVHHGEFRDQIDSPYIWLWY